MPRKSKQELAAAKQERAAAAAAAAHAARPFAHDSTDPYAGRDEDARRAVAEEIAAAKLAGASGNEMRATFGERLTGPARRKVLRTHGFDGTSYVARSYDSYRDGDPRTGTRHAREHGARAAERQAAAREQEARERVLALSAKQVRAMLREGGEPVPQVRKGDESALRDAGTAFLARHPEVELA